MITEFSPLSQVAMPSSSASAELSPEQEIIHILPELLAFLSKLSTTKSEPRTPRSSTPTNCLLSCWNTKSAVPTPNHLDLFNQSKKLEREIMYAKRALTELKGLDGDFSAKKSLERHSIKLKQIWNNSPKFDSGADVDPTTEVLAKISSLEKELKELRHQIYALPKKNHDTHGGDTGETVVGTTFDAYYLVGEKQSEDMKEKIQGCSAFLDFYEDFLEVFKDLNPKTKLCLLCFSVFPEKAVVKKRVLVQWWIGEAFIDDHSSATNILRDIVAKGFVEPELENRRLVGFKMDPLVRLVVVRIAEEFGFLSFNEMGVPADDFNWSHRACLVVRGKDSSRKQLTGGEHQEKSGVNQENSGDHQESSGDHQESRVHPEKSAVHQEKLHTLFNVNDPYPDFKKDWFSKLKNINVLCLGGWQGSAGQHIEIEDTEFLDALENMKYLKFISLQGISRITELPDSICKLKNLLILDLRACHNLEALPKNIVKLKNLTHLDISECYLLDHIPEGFASLSGLQVLKGFLIGQTTSKKSCGLKALADLKVLRKLSINTARKDFPTQEEVEVLHALKLLEKLKITWRGKSSKTQSDKSSRSEKAPLNSWYEKAIKRTCIDGNCAKQEDSSAQHPTSAQSAGQPALDPQPSKKSTSTDGTTATEASPDPREFKTNLQKLVLLCFPETTPPAWLTKGKLKPKKKLYISGGKLQSLCTEPDKDPWKVQVLRLQFLKELEGDWGEVQKSFPELIYLEKVECPRLTFFPCDGNGVWLKQESESKMEDLGLTWSFRRRKTAFKCI